MFRKYIDRTIQRTEVSVLMSLLPSPVSELLSKQGSLFHDVCLIDQDGVHHPANKALLATHSQFFLALFSSHPEEQSLFHLNIIKRTSDNALGLAMVLNWMEVGELELNSSNVLDVLQTAMYVADIEVVNMCENWLGSQLEPDNAIGFWICAKELYLTKLMDQAWDCILFRSTEVFKGDEFMELPQEMVSFIFGTDELTCKEEEIWMALESWVSNGDRNERMEAASQIMKRIRFGLIEAEYFRRVIRYSSIMMESIGEDIEQTLDDESKCKEESYLYRPRYPTHILFAFGGWLEGSVIDTIIM